jgi:predicted GNAT family N-acyltransferase
MAPMNEQPRFFVRQAPWAADRESLYAVRFAVFVEEQNVPPELELDEEDERSVHVLALAADGTAIGTGRLLRDGHIGRMAVLKAWRGRGVGGALMDHLLRLAATAGHRIVKLNAQTHAVGFYARHGFVAEGEEFMEAGIPHVVMTSRLGP